MARAALLLAQAAPLLARAAHLPAALLPECPLVRAALHLKRPLARMTQPLEPIALQVQRLQGPRQTSFLPKASPSNKGPRFNCTYCASRNNPLCLRPHPTDVRARIVHQSDILSPCSDFEVSWHDIGSKFEFRFPRGRIQRTRAAYPSANSNLDVIFRHENSLLLHGGRISRPSSR